MLFVLKWYLMLKWHQPIENAARIVGEEKSVSMRKKSVERLMGGMSVQKDLEGKKSVPAFLKRIFLKEDTGNNGIQQRTTNTCLMGYFFVIRQAVT